MCPGTLAAEPKSLVVYAANLFSVQLSYCMSFHRACHSLVVAQRFMFGFLLLLVGAGPAGTAGVVINGCADGAVPHEYMVTLRSPGGLHTKDDRHTALRGLTLTLC